jgi:hypothetical protein
MAVAEAHAELMHGVPPMLADGDEWYNAKFNPLIVTTPPPVETMLYGEPKDTTGESNVNIASDVPEKDVICISSCCCLAPSNFASTEIA